MNSHALRVLEYNRVCEILTSFAATGLGRARIAALTPIGDRDELAARLQEVNEMRGLIEAARLPLAGFKEVATAIRALVEGGRPAEPELLWDILELLRGGRALRSALTRESDVYPAMARVGRSIEDVVELRERIERSIDPKGGLRDQATEKLARLRAEVSQARESIRRRIARLLTTPRLQRAMQQEGVKFKNDRYLLPVKEEYRRWVPGVVRDRSQTGATLYVEPADLVIDGDDLLRLLDSERNEAQRILWELTRDVLAVEDVLRRIQDRVADVDLTYAKARYARAYQLSQPRIVDAGEGFALKLTEARHPYLMWMCRDETRGIHEPDLERVHAEVVALDVRLGNDRRILVVTGPNTGGKTVVLKTIGLNVLMALSGIPIAVGEGSCVPFVSNVFADIGDEQSIEQSLSTFSAHLTQIYEILRDGDPSALVLLDELGSGTDPLEGAALATALLEWFHGLGWHVIVTTHLGSLKEFAFTHDGAENAAMQFNRESLEPTFRMAVGLPGGSHALEIARRLGLLEEIVDAAQQEVDSAQGPTREVIEKMVDSHRRLEKERLRMQRLRQRAQGERRAAESDREEARVERDVWRKEAEILVDDVIRSARGKLVALVDKLRSVPKSHQPVVDELRWTLELLLTETPLGERREKFARSLKKEDEVYVPKFRERCKVRKINKTERVVTVLLNGIPTEIGFDDVSWLEEVR